jgi:predicted ATP-grasp superfamily ATP-dependent carboligase
MATPATRGHSRQPSTRAHTPGALPTTETNSCLSPETFDFLPPLHSLLARILLPSGAALPPPTGTGESTEGPETTSGTGHLDIKDLGAAVSVIKVRIQKARVAVRSMSDIERSMEEQEEEIRELEERIAKQRGVLKGLSENMVDRMDED